ncbi:hypothetical protein ACFVAJ_18845 [Agromyces sp. NPDC057679]|uniref:hypothetical protein n=1 Tax=Agromyces sp. NPDC057679 TaxID=3346207 RepID=UPI003670D19F
MAFTSGLRDDRPGSPKNWALHDARLYRNMPIFADDHRPWRKVRRAFEEAVRAGFYDEYWDADASVAHARKVISRLERIEAMEARAAS